MSFYELGKRVPIGAPSRKSLTPNEKRVYDLLREGKTPLEAARILHIRMGGAYELGANQFDVPIESVYNIIISIREKGYEIKSKEEIELAKLTEKDKKTIIMLKRQGCTVGDIAAQCNVSKSTAYAVIKAYEEHGDNSLAEDTAEEKNEPAAAATVTDSEETVLEKVSEDIIPDTGGDVKTHENTVPEIVLIALTDKLEDEMRRLKESEICIARLRAQTEVEEALRGETKEHIRELREHITKLGYGDVLIAFDRGDSSGT